MIVTGNVVAVKFSSFMNDQLGLNVLHFRCSSHTGVGVTPQAVATFMDGVIAPVLLPLLANTATYLGTSAKNLSDVPPTAAAVSVASTGPGTAGAAPLPQQTCGLFSLRTVLSGRHGRGRVYIPFPAQADNTAGDQPTAGYLARMAAYAAAVFIIQPVTELANSANLLPVVKPAMGLAVIDISQVLTRPNWATQRRRGAFGARNLQQVAV